MKPEALPLASTHSDLLDIFPEVSYEDWRAAVQSDLKDVPFEKKLISQTYEGIRLNPIYTSKDSEHLIAGNSLPGFAPFVRGRTASGYAGKPWDISQEIAFPSTLEFNTAARNSLERGLTALNMVLDRATRNGNDPDWAKPGEVGVGGLSITTLEDLQRALEGIDLEKVSLFIRAGSSALPFAALLVALARKRGTSTRSLRGCIEMDPLGVLSHEGALPHSLDGAYREMAELTRWSYSHAPELQTICIHARVWHESGGTAVQELAFTFATAIEYFRAMHQRDLSIDRVAPRVRLAITVGSNVFMEIAKLRAARMLWANVVKSLGGSEASQKVMIHARTSLWNKTRFDPWVNMLRGTTEAFAAVLGGCDSLQVGAFDEPLGLSDEFSRRIARNTQIILQKECDLTHTVDPAGGSWYVESLTDDLARRAWVLIQDIEKRGGMTATLSSGYVQGAIAQAADAKRQDLVHRRRILVGTNRYANPGEKILPRPASDSAQFERRRRQQTLSYRTQADEGQNSGVLERLGKVVSAPAGQLMDLSVEAILAGSTLGELTRSIRIMDGSDFSIDPVKIWRAAEPFEAVRDRVEARTLAQNHRPPILLLTMGPAAQHRARADFSKAFFEIAGFSVIVPKGFGHPDDAVAAAIDSIAIACVVCSTDETYPDLLVPLIQGIRLKRPEMGLILAGYPVNQVETYRKQGIDDFIHINADAVDVLTRLLNKAGVP